MFKKYAAAKSEVREKSGEEQPNNFVNIGLNFQYT